MTKITNVSGAGARGVESKTGTVYIEPGETVDVDLLDEKPLYEGLEAGAAAAKKAVSEAAAPEETK